jgi:hypothetical protein
MAKQALVYYKENFAGYLAETDEGYTFIYDEAYLKSKNAMPVSLTLPLQSEVYESRVLFYSVVCVCKYILNSLACVFTGLFLMLEKAFYQFLVVGHPPQILMIAFFILI